MADYEISRATGKCTVSGRTIEEGEDFYTVVVDAADGLERRDYSLDAWEGPPEGALCHFKTRLPRKDEPKKTFVDNDLMVNLFLRLADTEDARKLRFRFVLSLILLRKRLLKYGRTLREEAGEFWEMRLIRDKTTHRVYNPLMDESEIEEVSSELNVVLHGFAAEDVETAEGSEPTDQALSNEATEAESPMAEELAVEGEEPAN